MVGYIPSEFVSIQYIYIPCNFTCGKLSVEIQLRLSPCSFFGGNKYNPTGSTRTIDGSRCGVLQYSNCGYVIRIYIPAKWSSINYDKRIIPSVPRSQSPNAYK